LAERAEALAQLARMLGDESLRTVPPEEARVSLSLDRLADALVVEATASDDVYDRSSALTYLEQRLQFLSPVLDPSQLEPLREALNQRVEQW
jgi:hypothetical protein